MTESPQLGPVAPSPPRTRWGRVRERGYSIVPLKIYFKDGRAKVEIALAKGKQLHDKRDALARKATRREIERVLKGRNR